MKNKNIVIAIIVVVVIVIIVAVAFFMMSAGQNPQQGGPGDAVNPGGPAIGGSISSSLNDSGMPPGNASGTSPAGMPSGTPPQGNDDGGAGNMPQQP